MVKELQRTLKDLIYTEKQVERIKIELSLQADFSIGEAFKAFDFRCLFNMDILQFTEAVVSFAGIDQYTREQAKWLFHKYASPKFGIQEFAQLVLARDPVAYSRVEQRN